MKKSKLLAIVLCIAIFATQFTMFGGIIGSAETATDASVYQALTGRDDFAFGVNIHSYSGFDAYKNTAEVISDASALGSNIVRTNFVEDNMAYNVAVADMVAKKGMDVMYIVSLKNFVMNTDEEGNTTYIDAADVDIEAIKEYYTELATAYKGKAAYYQLGNEIDTKYYLGNGTAGMTYAGNYRDVSALAVAINAATEAIKAIDENAKIVVNYCWLHTGFIQGIKSIQLDSTTGYPATAATADADKAIATWDIIGLDWYLPSDNVDFINPADNEPYSYNDSIESLSAYPEKVMICETNIRPNGWDDEIAQTSKYQGEPSLLADFLTYCYGNDKVVGFIAYELYDEPVYIKAETTPRLDEEGKEVTDEDGNVIYDNVYDENGNIKYKYTKEAFLGLIDKDGNKKETYNTLCALYGGKGVDTDWYAPEMIASEGQLTLNVGEAFAGTYGTAAVKDSWFPRYNPSSCFLSEQTDFTKYGYIEFDYFVENIDNLKARASAINVEIMRHDGGKWLAIPFIDELTVNGWNHVKVAIPKGEKDSVIKTATQVRFCITMPESQVAATDLYIIANVRATIDSANSAPTMVNSEGMLKVYEGVKLSGELGSAKISDNNLPGYSSSNAASAYLSETDFTKYDYVEFDLYIDSLENFKARATTMTLEFVKSSGGKYTSVSYYDQITKDGWNHIKIGEIPATDRTQACNQLRFCITLSESDIGATDRYKVANICATINSANLAPAMVNSEGMLKVYEGVKLSGELGSTKINDNHLPGYNKNNPASVSLSATDFTKYDYVEFDLYIDSLDNFKSRATTMTLEFVKSGGTYIGVSYYDQVTKDGWNHIKIAEIPDSDKTKACNQLRFCITLSASDVGATDRYRVANICATMDIANLAPAMVSSEVMLKVCEGIELKGTLGTTAINDNNLPGYNKNNPASVSLSATDFTIYDYVEFDLYIDSLENFKARATTMTLEFVKSGGKYTSVSYYDQITKDGWNHIKIAEIPDTDRAKACNQLRFCITLSESDVGATDRYRVANICATMDITAPTDIMSERIDIIKGIKMVDFDNNGFYDIEIDGSTELNLNLSATRMIELDVFVNNNQAINTLTIDLTDANEVYASYEFEGLTEGWNHLAVRLNDFVGENGTLDFTSIKNISLVKEEGKVSAFIANFYAANYVEGDANRDGEVNILDFVRMKKYSVEISTVGNLVAMDVKGNDYEVNAADLTEMRRYLLTDSWSEN